MLYQRRLGSMLALFSVQSMMVAALAFWMAALKNAPDLFITGAITMLLKGGLVPLLLMVYITKLDVRREVQPAYRMGWTIALALALVTLSILISGSAMAGSNVLERNMLALGLSLVLMGFLTMIVRHNAVCQVIGFISIENGMLLAVIGAGGMPMIIELSIALAVFFSFIIFGIFFFHIRERFDTLDIRYIDAYRRDRE